MRAAVPAPGEARPDWAIAADFARRLAARLGKSDDGFAWPDEAAVFAEHARLSVGRDCDIGGLSHALLDACGPQQWPFPTGAPGGTPRLFTDHRFATPDGRARFSPVGLPVRQALLPERVDAQHPFVLLSGRLRDQWHGMSRTGRVPALWGHAPRAELGMNPVDLLRRGFSEGQLVRIASRQGEMVLPLVADAGVAPGQLWLPMHWGSATLAQPGANALTVAACDPLSWQPALKQAAVSVRPYVPAWSAVWAVVAPDSATLEAWRSVLQALLADVDHAALSLSGRGRTVLQLRLAHHVAPEPGWLARIDRLLGCDPAQAMLAFDDPRRGVAKRARVEAGQLLALRFVNEAAALDWLLPLMEAGRPLGELRAWLFAPLARPPASAGMADAGGRVVCSCHGVSAGRIEAELAQGADLAGLQQALKCGTACGSCLPALRRMVSASMPAA